MLFKRQWLFLRARNRKILFYFYGIKTKNIFRKSDAKKKATSTQIRTMVFIHVHPYLYQQRYRTSYSTLLLLCMYMRHFLVHLSSVHVYSVSREPIY